ncbi:MAG: hypothetical protein Tsb002_05050 [Wenzhouxiangellaceae bacterium]
MKKYSVLLLAACQMAFAQMAEDPAATRQLDEAMNPDEASRNRVESASTEYVGDNIRIGIGWDSEFDLTGELLWVFDEDHDSAWIGEGWIADGAAAGLKLNYHWLTNGQSVATDEQGNPVYQDGRVYKAFVAADQNQFDDRKLTFGGGVEQENLFLSLYGMKSISGRRDLSTNITTVNNIVTGVIGNHTFSRTDTLQTITDVYAHPYEWGLGMRFGGYITDHNMRLRGGLDFEDGKFGARQTTLSASLDKYFKGGHGLSLRLAYADKDGRFETDKSDLRGGIFYTYDFGSSYRPTRILADQQITVTPDEETVTRSRVVSNQVKIESRTQFDLDRAVLKDEALSTLDEIVAKLNQMEVISKIRIVGHTCDLGTDQYNLDLSNRRAQAVANYLVSRGIDEDRLMISALGESQPRVPNTSEENRSRNRRVELEFLTVQEDTQEIQVAAEPTVEWRQVEVPQEAAWIRRALRNPVRHKRVVDYYRVEETTTNFIEGDPQIDNTGPQALDDQFTVDINSSANVFSVLDNDSDGEDDTLTITATTSPANGAITVSGSNILYTPNTDFSGLDSFTYTVDDGFGGSASATVTVRVQEPNTQPVANDDSATTEQDTPVTIAVLGNDSDPDGDALSILEVGAPANGAVIIVGDSVVYTPDSGFFGSDSFSYTVDDGAGGTATATVSVTVQEQNRPPQANDDTARTAKDTSVVIDVLANDIDPDNDPLTIIEITLEEPPKGTVEINADGTLTYTPNRGWWGGDQFTYTVSDGRGGTDTATVVLTVTAG